MKKESLTIGMTEVHEMMGVDVRTLRKAVALGQIKSLRIGHTIRFSRAYIEELLRSGGFGK